MWKWNCAGTMMSPSFPLPHLAYLTYSCVSGFSRMFSIYGIFTKEKVHFVIFRVVALRDEMGTDEPWIWEINDRGHITLIHPLLQNTFNWNPFFTFLLALIWFISRIMSFLSLHFYEMWTFFILQVTLNVQKNSLIFVCEIMCRYHILQKHCKECPILFIAISIGSLPIRHTIIWIQLPIRLLQSLVKHVQEGKGELT